MEEDGHERDHDRDHDADRDELDDALAHRLRAYFNGWSPWDPNRCPGAGESATSEGQVRPGEGVANLKGYTVEHGKFLGTATGLPVKAVHNDLLQHLLELKGQLDAMSKGQYARAAAFYQDAYARMFMTADLLSGAIAKQKDLPK